MKIVITNITCGENCWEAREVDCCCSCGGRNHGILKRGGEQPARTKKAGGKVYTLVSVGTRMELFDKANLIIPVLAGKANANAGWFDYNPAKAGNPILIAYATADQCRRWAELSQWKELADDEQEFYFVSPALMWRRDDIDANLFAEEKNESRI